MPDDQMVELQSFAFLPEARAAEDLLAEAGIPCLLADEHMGTANWAYVNDNRGVRLMVPASRAEEAAEVMRAFVEMQATEVPEHELAAQAEEAGSQEDL